MRKDSRLMEFNTMINRLLRANPESGEYTIGLCIQSLDTKQVYLYDQSDIINLCMFLSGHFV